MGKRLLVEDNGSPPWVNPKVAAEQQSQAISGSAKPPVSG